MKGRIARILGHPRTVLSKPNLRNVLKSLLSRANMFAIALLAIVLTISTVSPLFNSNPISAAETAGYSPVLQTSVDSRIESIPNQDKATFMYFYADWCPHCQQQKPIIDALEQGYRDDISFIRVNGEAYPDAMSQFGVTGFPSMLLITDQATKQFRGFTEEEILRENFEQAVNNVSKSVVESNPLLTSSTEYESSPSTCSSSDPDVHAEFDWHMPEPFGDFDSDGMTDYRKTAESIDPPYWREATVQDWLIVGVGDSYASGEGYPYISVADALELASAAIEELATAASPQAAKGATIQLDKTEYSVGEPMVISGTGFTTAGTSEPITIVPSSAQLPGDLDLQGLTFDDAVTALQVSAVHRIPLNIPGLEALPPLTFNFEYDDVKLVIALDAQGVSPFVTPSPLTGVEVKLLILATWTSGTDTAPEVALAIRVESQNLNKIIGSWTIPGVSDETALTSAVIVLSATGIPQTITASNLDNLAAAKALLTVDGVLENLTISQVASLRAKMDLAANPAFARVADFLGMGTSSALILRGAIDDAATFLFDAEFDFDGDFLLEGPIVIDSDELPPWLLHEVGDIPKFRLVFDGGTPQVFVEDEFTIQTGNVANIFTYSVSLDEAEDLDLRLAAATFNVPYGLDGLGAISQVELHISFDQASGVFTGEFDASMSIGGAEQDLYITINDDPANTRAIVNIDGTIPVAGVVDWLSGASDLGSPGLTEVNFASATLGDIEFSYDHMDTNGTVMGLHATIAGIETFGAILHTEFLLGLDKPALDDPTVLAALRVVDPACTPSPCIGLKQVFALPDASLDLELTLPQGNFLALYPEGSTFRTSRLGPEAKAFLDDVNGSPASEPFQVSGSLNFIADIPTTGLNPMFDRLGLSPLGGPVHVQGSAGFTLTSLDTGTLNLNNFHVEATLPGSAPKPQDVPSWLVWPSTESWKLFLDFEENDVAIDTDDRLTIGLSINGITSTLFPVVEGAFTASFSGTPAANPSAWTIEAKFEVGPWVHPFEVDWLSLEGAYALVRIEQPSGGQIVASAQLCGTAAIGTPAAVVEVCASVAGTNPPSGDLTLRLVEPVSLGDIVTLTGLLPSSISLPDQIGDSALGPGSLTFKATGDGSFSIAGTIIATFLPFGSPIGLDLMLLADFPASGGPTTAIGLKLAPGQSLGSLLGLDLPEGLNISFTPVNDAGVPDPSIGGFAFVFATGAVSVGDPNLSQNIADWFSPLYGGDLEGRTLLGGVGVLGSTRLPEPLAGLVTTLGADPDLLISGNVDLNPEAFSASLQLAMSLREEALPDFIDDISLSLGASITAANPSLSVRMGGSMDLRFKQGLEQSVALPLQQAGLQLPIALEQLQGSGCPRGGFNEKAPDDKFYCYDKIRIMVNAAVTLAAAPPSFRVSFAGDLSSLNEGGLPWAPMGLEAVGISQLGAQVEIAYVPPSTAEFKVGLIGSMTLFDNPMAGALQVGASVTFAPPPVFVTAVVPIFDGFRFALPNGIGKDQLDDLYAAFGQAPSAPELDLEPYLDTLPDISFRNLVVSFSPVLPGGLTSLCIPAGIIFRADLYAGAAPLSSTTLPLCNRDTGEFPFPAPSELCTDREGCVAGVNIELKPTGIIMEGSMVAFEIEPLDMRFDDAIVALRLTLADQYVRIHGGVEVGPEADPTLVGRMSLGLGIGTVTFAGQAKAFDFNALVAGGMNINPLTLLTSTNPADFGTLTLHVVLAAPEMTLPEYASPFPDFSEKVRADLETTIDELAQIVEFINSTLGDFTLDPLGTLLSLSSQIAEEGYDAGILPSWVALIATENSDAEEDIGDREASFTLEDLVNGFSLPGIEMGYLTCAAYDLNGNCVWPVDPPVCFGFDIGGTCYLWPPLTFASICNSFPASIADGGYCSDEEFQDELELALANLITQVEEFSGVTNLTGVIDTVNGWLDPGSGVTVFSLDCASLDVELSLLGENQFEIALAPTLLNQALQLGFQWDFNDHLGSAASLLAALIQSGSGSGVCEGVDLSLFGEGGLGNPEAAEPDEEELPPLTVGITSPASVNEGSTLSGSVTLNRTVVAEDGAVSVTVDWGDNSADTILSFGEGDSSKAISHIYADDNPTGTASDAVTITATMAAPNASSDSTVVIVKNVAPRNLALALSNDAVINEDDEVTLTVNWEDRGVDDTFMVRIDWDDGLVENHSAMPGQTFTHRYLDDNPTGTASDQYTIRVRVRDDDTGTTKANAALTVNNVAPVATSIDISPSEVNEGDEQEFTFTWDDPGSLDSYMVYIDWDGNGTYEEIWKAGSDQSLTVTHMFLDDHPETGTPWDNIEVKVRVVDDDTGVANSVEVVKVNNVAPTLCIVVDPSAGDPVKGTSCLNVSLTINEGGSVTARGVFQDPGVLDTHTVTIDWGYDAFPDTTFNFAPNQAHPMLDWHAFSASQIYGDNGTYTITVEVEDDDTGAATATATITVNNVDPTVDINETEAGPGVPGTILADGSGAKDDGTLDVPTFVTRAGTAVQFAAHATDPGSDDLSFTWNWGDGSPMTVVTSLVNPPNADLANSPSVQPRDIITTAVHTWTKACLYNVNVDVLDDDSGTERDETSVVVTGTERRIFAPGYWYNQYDQSKKSQNLLPQETLECYRRVVNHMSRVFGVNPNQFWLVKNFADMRNALNTRKTSRDTEIMQRQLMAAWLNFANGSIQWFDLVDTNRDLIPDMQFGQVMRESEELRLNPTATRAQLLAQEAILKIVNGD